MFRSLQPGLKCSPIQKSGPLASIVTAPWRPLNSHRSPSHPIHVLEFLSDMGLRDDDLGLRGANRQAYSRTCPRRVSFRVPMVIPKHFGGSGVEEMAWVICDAPMIVSSLAQMGLADDPRIVRAALNIAAPVIR